MVHAQHVVGRPPGLAPSDDTVLNTHKNNLERYVQTAKRLKREGQDTRYRDIYNIMKSEGLVVDSPAKSKQHRWVRYERIYSKETVRPHSYF
ncbi:MAG: hypothetical protein F4Y18_00040 [Cenarchaeum sp. SB0663_bin_5]|nr:hypothetical protein [Cenarchaeum sp. SB0663_bin_5]MYH03676.1 hypothetical protein [Cenarchaeum sp. SB0675_bin_21]